jgi:hypothetical protein
MRIWMRARASSRSVVALLGLGGTALGGCGPRAEGEAPVATEIEVAVGDGADAGLYAIRSDEVLCSEESDGPRSWEVRYAPWRRRGGLGSVRLVVTDTASGPRGSSLSSEALRLELGFGTLLGGRVHQIETRPSMGEARGSARAEVQRLGGSATVRVRGRAADGVYVEATVHCRRLRESERPEVGIHY